MTSATYTQHIKKLLLLAYPVTLSQLGHMMVGLADTYMAGKLGGVFLAAASFAFAFYFPFLFFGIGISSGSSPLIAKAHGEHDKEHIRALFWQSLYMNVFTGIVLTVLLFWSASSIRLFTSNEALLSRAIPFLQLIALSILPSMIYQSFRQYAEGLFSTAPAMYISLAGTFLNVVLNWFFAYGKFGFPEMGLNGIAMGTVLSRIAMALFMAGYVVFAPSLNNYFKGLSYDPFRWSIMKKVLTKSLPVGVQLSMESAVFGLGAIFISWLNSTTAIAAHHIALNLAATSYMAATGLTAAVSVRVGYEWGAGHVKEIRKAGMVAFAMVSVFMLSISVLFVLFRFELPALFVTEVDIIQTTASLLIIAAVFQLADGVQVIGIGALRGIGDVVAPTIIALLAYWVIGLPIGYWLTFSQGMGVQGIWYGFTIGLFIAALLMFVRFRILSGRIADR
jgi:multidrug resistance protein, MATE family